MLEEFLVERSFELGGRRAVLVAFANSGYVQYTSNLVESLRRLGLERHLVLFATDAKSGAQLEAACQLPVLVYTPPDQRRMASALLGYQPSNPAWGALVRTKVELVYTVLAQGYDVLYTDGDVVWLQSPLAYLSEALQSGVAAPQERGFPQPSAPPLLAFQLENGKAWLDPVALCSGLFYAQAAPQTLELFDPLRMPAALPRDQTYINTRIKQCDLLARVLCLPRCLFPDGAWWFKHQRALTWADGRWRIASGELPYAVHFNWVQGGAKQPKMAQYGLWLVPRAPAKAAPRAAAKAQKRSKKKKKVTK